MPADMLLTGLLCFFLCTRLWQITELAELRRRRAANLSNVNLLGKGGEWKVVPRLKALGDSNVSHVCYARPLVTALDSVRNVYHLGQILFDMRVIVPPTHTEICKSNDFKIFFIGGKYLVYKNYELVTERGVGKRNLSTVAREWAVKSSDRPETIPSWYQNQVGCYDYESKEERDSISYGRTFTVLTFKPNPSRKNELNILDIPKKVSSSQIGFDGEYKEKRDRMAFIFKRNLKVTAHGFMCYAVRSVRRRISKHIGLAANWVDMDVEKIPVSVETCRHWEKENRCNINSSREEMGSLGNNSLESVTTNCFLEETTFSWMFPYPIVEIKTREGERNLILINETISHSDSLVRDTVTYIWKKPDLSKFCDYILSSVHIGDVYWHSPFLLLPKAKQTFYIPPQTPKVFLNDTSIFHSYCITKALAQYTKSAESAEIYAMNTGLLIAYIPGDDDLKEEPWPGHIGVSIRKDRENWLEKREMLEMFIKKKLPSINENVLQDEIVRRVANAARDIARGLAFLYFRLERLVEWLNTIIIQTLLFAIAFVILLGALYPHMVFMTLILTRVKAKLHSPASNLKRSILNIIMAQFRTPTPDLLKYLAKNRISPLMWNVPMGDLGKVHTISYNSYSDTGFFYQKRGKRVYCWNEFPSSLNLLSVAVRDWNQMISSVDKIRPLFVPQNGGSGGSVVIGTSTGRVRCLTSMCLAKVSLYKLREYKCRAEKEYMLEVGLEEFMCELYDPDGRGKHGLENDICCSCVESLQELPLPYPYYNYYKIADLLDCLMSETEKMEEARDAFFDCQTFAISRINGINNRNNRALDWIGCYGDKEEILKLEVSPAPWLVGTLSDGLNNSLYCTWKDFQTIIQQGPVL